MLHAAHVRTRHVHSIVSGDEEPDEMIRRLKSKASKALNRRGLDDGRRKRWARGGSKPHLWTAKQFWDAMDYVLLQQGRPMAVYVHPAYNLTVECEPNPFEEEPGREGREESPPQKPR